MTNKLKTDSKLVSTIWWVLFIAVIVLFAAVISGPFLKNSLVSFIYQTLFSKNTVLNEEFLHQYQMFYISIPILLTFLFCILVFAVSLIFKKYKKADWIIAVVCLIVAMSAVIIPIVPTFNRADNAACEVHEMVVEERFIKNGFRNHSSWVKLGDGTEVRVYGTQYERISDGDTVYVVYFEDHTGQTPVVFTKDKYSLPAS